MCGNRKAIPADIGSYLSYNPDTGKLVYIGKTHRGTSLGSEAGSLNNKTVYIGLFDTIEEGVAARDNFNLVNKFHASHGMRGDLSAA